MSDYNSFWFVDTRDQKVNLKRWIIWGVLLFLFVSVGTYICMKSIYNPIPSYEIHSDILAVKVEDAKATNINGYVKGMIENATSEELSGKYIKCDFYNKEDELKGTEYIEIGTIQSGETKKYEVQFKYDKIEKFILTIVDNKEN